MTLQQVGSSSNEFETDESKSYISKPGALEYQYDDLNEDFHCSEDFPPAVPEDLDVGEEPVNTCIFKFNGRSLELLSTILVNDLMILTKSDRISTCRVLCGTS